MTQEPQRPDPDKLLEQVSRPTRGKLKYFSVPVRVWGKPTPCSRKRSACVHKG